jgi:hypothetical protein
MSVQVKHVVVLPSELQVRAKKEGVAVGTNMIEWWLEKHAPGKLVGVTSFLQPVPGSQLMQNPQIEPAFHFFFECVPIVTHELHEGKS